MTSPGGTFYFASHRSASNPNSREINLLSPRQEKNLAKDAKAATKASTANQNPNLLPTTHETDTEPPTIQIRPAGSKIEEFFSRPVVAARQRNESIFSEEDAFQENQKEMIARPSADYTDPPIGSFVLERKVPTKIEPKVFFAAERTFLLWMHSALWLLGASMTFIAYGYDDPQKIMYGVILLPVALAFICYSLFQCEFLMSVCIFNYRLIQLAMMNE